MVESPGYLLQPVGDEDHGPRSPVHADPRKGLERDLAATEVKARGRLIQNQQIRIGHQRPTDEDARPLPLG